MMLQLQTGTLHSRSEECIVQNLELAMIRLV